MAVQPELYAGRGGKKSIERVREHYRSAEERKLSGNAKTALPALPSDAIDYLRVSLELTPNEYMDTSHDFYETALLYQNARAEGIEAARANERKRAERDAKQAASLAKLRARR